MAAREVLLRICVGNLCYEPNQPKCGKNGSQADTLCMRVRT